MNPLLISCSLLIALNQLISYDLSGKFWPALITAMAVLLFMLICRLIPSFSGPMSLLIGIAVQAAGMVIFNDLGTFATVFALVMTLHLYAWMMAYINRNQPTQPQDTGWIYSGSFFASFLPLYLMFNLAIPHELGELLRIIAVFYIVVMLLMMEFSRQFTTRRARILFSATFISLLLFLFSLTYIGASATQKAMPIIAAKTKQGVEYLIKRKDENQPKVTPPRRRQISPDGIQPQTDGVPIVGLSEKIQLHDRSNLRQSSKPVLHVELHDPTDLSRLLGSRAYVRSKSSVTYEDNEWTTPPSIEIIEDGADGTVDNLIEWGTRPRKDWIKHTLYFNNRSGTLLALDGIQAVELDTMWRTDEDHYTFNPRWQGRIQITAHSAPINYESIVRKPLQVGNPGAEYIEVPTGQLMDKISALAHRESILCRTPQQVIEAHRNFLATEIAYSLRMENPKGLPPLENFLFEERKGYCSFFATAFTLMLRSKGIPARISSGYSGGEYNPKTGLITFASKDAHAWTEVHFKDHGWVVVDPTPDTENAPAAPGLPQITDHSTQPDLSVYDDMQAAAAPTSAPSYLRGGGSYGGLFIPANLWIAAALLLLAMTWILGKEASGFVQATEKKEPLGFFKLLTRKFSKVGQRRKPGATPREYIKQLEEAGLIQGEFDDAIRYYYQVHYMDQPRVRHLEKQFTALVKNHRITKHTRG